MVVWRPFKVVYSLRAPQLILKITSQLTPPMHLNLLRSHPQVSPQQPMLTPMRFGIRIHHGYRIMDHGYHEPLGARDVDPLGLQTYATLPGRAKAAALFDDQRFHVLDCWLTFTAYRGRRDLRIQSKAPCENVDGCFRAGDGIPRKISISHALSEKL